MLLSHMCCLKRPSFVINQPTSSGKICTVGAPNNLEVLLMMVYGLQVLVGIVTTLDFGFVVKLT
jgi:hypothetical protein